MFEKFKLTESIIVKEKRNVDRSIKSLTADLQQENTLLPDTPMRIVQRVVRIYKGFRPVLVVFTKLPIIPQTWTGVADVFIRALDALVDIDVTASFKAGRDL